MEAFLVSSGIVALAEIGDKTQLLAFLLAARLKAPVPIIAGIFIATLLNHVLAGVIGLWIAELVNTSVLRWVLGLSFIAMAIWTMVPDKIDNEEIHTSSMQSIFFISLVSFFLAEIGDKTQFATVAMTIHYGSAWLVVLGTTLGILIADIPAVIIGERLTTKISLRLMHGIAAALFLILGMLTLFSVNRWFT